MAENTQNTDTVGLTSDLVSAFVSNNAVSATDLPKIIAEVYGALTSLSADPKTIEAAPPTPAVSVRKSITPDFLISLEDGKHYKSLKRHLSTRGMTPEEYRAKWGLPRDYPMVAANYSAQRSQLAKALGLGQGGRVSPPAEPEPAPVAEPVEATPTKRGRRKAA